MPQLAPMNWILLMLFFWTMMFFINISIWWMKKKDYSIKFKENKYIKNKSKSWTW